MMRRPPRSTLFPTRRSSDLGGVGSRRHDVDVHLIGQRLTMGVADANGQCAHLRWFPASSIRDTDMDESGEGASYKHKDRKSTRLNSSHSQISYAVFCLKKKT